MCERRPNVLIILCELLRADSLGCYGNQTVLTPTIDNIAERGVRFASSYSTCPVCVPARRSLMSGQFPATHAARSNVETEWDIESTLGRVFRDNGYQTTWIGRSMHQYPARKRFGFEEVVLLDHRCDDDYDEFLRRNRTEGMTDYYGSGVRHNDWTARPFHLPEHLHSTNWTVYEATRFLDRRDPVRPYCAVVSFLAAHPPLVPPQCYFERYVRTGVPAPHLGDWTDPSDPQDVASGPDPEWRVELSGEALLSCRAGYYGLINHLDDQIRRLLSAVDTTSTIIVFTADHGEMLGDHHLWRKKVPYEGSAHIPLLFQAPDSLGLNSSWTVGAPTCLEDVMPTVLDLAGVGVPETVEGKSLVPLMRDTGTSGQSHSFREHVHIECAPLHHTLTDGKEKYIWFVRDGREQFFRLETDANECRDLSHLPEEAERVAYWRRRLIRELSDRPEGFVDGGALVAGRPYAADGRVQAGNQI